MIIFSHASYSFLILYETRKLSHPLEIFSDKTTHYFIFKKADLQQKIMIIDHLQQLTIRSHIRKWSKSRHFYCGSIYLTIGSMGYHLLIFSWFPHSFFPSVKVFVFFCLFSCKLGCCAPRRFVFRLSIFLQFVCVPANPQSIDLIH